MVPFLVSEWFIDEVSAKVITACNSQSKHVQQKYHGDTKFNFVSRNQKGDKMS